MAEFDFPSLDDRMGQTNFEIPLLIHHLLPKGSDCGIAPIFAARAMRGFADGFVAVLLPVYLLEMGLGGVEVGAIATATLFGSAFATLAVGAWGHRWTGRGLMLGAAALMVVTGLGFSVLSSFWPLLIVAFVGTLNPSSGDVSVFLPLEHARLAAASDTASRTDLFARYALTGALCAALGALASGLPERVVALSGITKLDALRGMFVLYGIVGAAVWAMYRKLPVLAEVGQAKPASLGPSKAVVVKLAALFSVDSFAAVSWSIRFSPYGSFRGLAFRSPRQEPFSSLPGFWGRLHNLRRRGWLSGSGWSTPWSSRIFPRACVLSPQPSRPMSAWRWVSCWSAPWCRRWMCPLEAHL